MTEELVRERNEALFSFDKWKILRYMEKYGLTSAKRLLETSEFAFWLTTCEAVLRIKSAPEEVRDKAMAMIEEIMDKEREKKNDRR